jgi:hypothetical protein
VRGEDRKRKERRAPGGEEGCSGEKDDARSL